METITNPIKLDRLGLGKSQGFRSNHYTRECHIKNISASRSPVPCLKNVGSIKRLH